MVIGDKIGIIIPYHTDNRLVIELVVEKSPAISGRAIVYTLMETAKANNQRLEDYIEHLLTVLPERLVDDLDADIDDLLPWADGMQKMFTMR